MPRSFACFSRSEKYTTWKISKLTQSWSPISLEGKKWLSLKLICPATMSNWRKMLLTISPSCSWSSTVRLTSSSCWDWSCHTDRSRVWWSTTRPSRSKTTSEPTDLSGHLPRMMISDSYHPQYWINMSYHKNRLLAIKFFHFKIQMLLSFQTWKRVEDIFD